MLSAATTHIRFGRKYALIITATGCIATDELDLQS